VAAPSKHPVKRLWIVGATTILGGAAAFSTYEGGQLGQPWQGRLTIVAIALVATSGLLQGVVAWRREQIRDYHVPVAVSEAEATMRVALGDTLEPLMSQLADMAQVDDVERREIAHEMVTAVLNSVTNLVGPDRTRACWFILDNDGDMLRCKSFTGRAGRSRTTFRRGQPAGDTALLMLDQDKFFFCRDTAVDAPTGFASHKPHDYQTFISVPVRTARTIFGMITVDAPEPGDLSEDHVTVVRVLAQTLATAMAMAD
jgi:transcriptional regulator with GAF, ATPase, and Fis domain